MHLQRSWTSWWDVQLDDGGHRESDEHGCLRSNGHEVVIVQLELLSCDINISS